MVSRQWRVQIDGESHRVGLEHSPWTLRRRIVVDGRELSTAPSNYERVLDWGSDHQFEIAGHRASIAIRPAWGGLWYRYELGVDGVDVDTGAPFAPPALADLRLFPGDGTLVRHSRPTAGVLALLAVLSLGAALYYGKKLGRHPESPQTFRLSESRAQDGQWVKLLDASIDCAEARRLGRYSHAVAGRTRDAAAVIVTFSRDCRCGECDEPTGILSRPTQRFAQNIREALGLEPETELYVVTTYAGPGNDRLGLVTFAAFGAALTLLSGAMFRRGQLWRQARAGPDAPLTA